MSLAKLGLEGKLGGQAQVSGVMGTAGRTLLIPVNFMATAILTAQVRNICRSVATPRLRVETYRAKSPSMSAARFSNSKTLSIRWWINFVPSLVK